MSDSEPITFGPRLGAIKQADALDRSAASSVCSERRRPGARSTYGETRTRTGDTTIFRDRYRRQKRQETPANRRVSGRVRSTSIPADSFGRLRVKDVAGPPRPFRARLRRLRLRLRPKRHRGRSSQRSPPLAHRAGRAEGRSILQYIAHLWLAHLLGPRPPTVPRPPAIRKRVQLKL
jgi:hypothetical protein